MAEIIFITSVFTSVFFHLRKTFGDKKAINKQTRKEEMKTNDK